MELKGKKIAILGDSITQGCGVEKEENFYNWQENFCIIKALEKGFLEGEYECDFPKLIIISKKKLLVDFDSDTIEDYIVTFNKDKAQEL